MYMDVHTYQFIYISNKYTNEEIATYAYVHTHTNKHVHIHTYTCRINIHMYVLFAGRHI